MNPPPPPTRSGPFVFRTHFWPPDFMLNVGEYDDCIRMCFSLFKGGQGCGCLMSVARKPTVQVERAARTMRFCGRTICVDFRYLSAVRGLQTPPHRPAIFKHANFGSFFQPLSCKQIQLPKGPEMKANPSGPRPTIAKKGTDQFEA